MAIGRGSGSAALANAAACDAGVPAEPVLTAFTYSGPGLGGAGPELAQRQRFEAQFQREIQRVQAWAGEARWTPTVVPELAVFVSAEYRISKALAHVWSGDAGRMEFPLSRVAAGRAAIAHELVHVFLPNANRLLAEGLAIYLQSEIGGNPAFPNFGRPLHDLACDRLQEMLPGFSSGDAAGLERIRLAELDGIATPSPLMLTVGDDLNGEDARGQARLYALAGSFVQFLIETRGLDRFHDLYEQTPLVPRVQNAGTADRWRRAYDVPLENLEREWKSLIAQQRR